MTSPKLKMPSYLKISEAAMTNSGDSLTLLSLASITTKTKIYKQQVVASGTIGSTKIDFKSLEDYDSGVSEIYVTVPGINHTGAISLTMKSGLVSSKVKITEDDCSNLVSLYYGQNFESLNSVSNYCKTDVVSAQIAQNSTYGKYLEVNSDSTNRGYFISTEDLNVPTNGSYILEFDAAIANSNNSKNTSIFYILTDQTNVNKYLLKLSSKTPNTGNNKLTWYINDSDTDSVEFGMEFLHYKLIVDRTNNKIGLSIYTLSNNVILEEHLINKSSSSTSDIAKCFYMNLSRNASGLIRLNNISVYSYENAQISSSFTQNTLTMSLGSDLKLISDVNKSSYCSVSFKDTEVTIKSTKSGKTYIYFEGILKANDNKALLLLIIKIDENLSISCEKKYIFSTDLSFNKTPSTIQKEFKTYSSVDNLDTSEPSDNSKITPCVDVDELNSKFSQFDSEDSIKPRVKVAYCITNKKWCILYTKDSKITEYSEYILYGTTYDGLLDCVNASFDFLTTNRKTKEKISIITSGSTGKASQNLNSMVSKSNRMYGSVAIICQSYCILDFEDNIIYVDYSEKYTNQEGKEFSIGCFINFERNIQYASVCNLNLIGIHDYCIYVAGSSYLLFQNINVSLAQGEKKSGFIGIRVQSQATAIANVELSRWSHDIYIDNCTFNGLEEHGIETYNVYNFYATTVKVSDVGGCGILLNCTYNAWIDTVICKRCCASGTYAAVRFANNAGPNINLHYVYGEACGNGIFLVSSSTDITIDKINLINTHTHPIFLSGSAGLHIQSGQVITNGGELKYCENGEIGTRNASTIRGSLFVNGSSSQFFPQWNSILENLKISGFNYGYCERYKMSSNYNIYNNVDTSGCKQVKNAEENGTGTTEDIPFGFCVIDGKKGVGNEVITGNKITSGDYTYALNKDSSSYIILGYSGSETVLIVPKKYNGKPISRIGSFAFYGNKNLISVTIESNITSLGGLSFGDCKSLKTVTFKSGGSYEIGHCAFRGCEKLVNLDLTGVKILRGSCFAWCKSLQKVVCPKSVVYFGVNCFYNDNIDLTIECNDINSMTVEPYAFYFIGFNSKIKFTGISQPTSLTNVPGNGNNSYYNNSQNYVEANVYKKGVWCRYYYHVAVTPTFK